MPNPPILPDITIQGPFWTARAAVLTAPLSSKIANQAVQWASHTRTIFVDSTPRKAFGYEKAYLPGTMLALCYMRSVQIGTDALVPETYRWERAANEPMPAAETVEQIKTGIQTGKLTLLLLEADPQQLASSNQGIFTCIAGDIVLDSFTPQNNALERLLRALDLEVPTAETRWKAIAHSSGFSVYGQIDLPWRDTRITVPLQLAKVLYPVGETGAADFRLTIEAERLTEGEETALIQAWRSLSIYLNPKNPLNDLPTPSANPTPTWVTLEIADPLSVPRLYWEITNWQAQPNRLSLHFDRQEINLLLSDQQPYDSTYLTASLARVIPHDVTLNVENDGTLEIVVTAQSERTLTGGQIQYVWGAESPEQFKITGLEVAFDPVETPEFVRDYQKLPIPHWFPGEESQTVAPAVVWGFMPLEDGWAQLPIPNLTEQIYLDSDLSNFDGRETQLPPPLLQGAVSIGNDVPDVLAANPDEQPWNLTLTDAQHIQGTWTLRKPDATAPDYDLQAVELDITAPETVLNGLFWLSTGASSAEDALPDLSDWVFGLQRIPLKTIQPNTALFPAAVTFGLNDFSFTARATEAQRPSATITGWSFIYQVKQVILTRMIDARVLPEDTFAALLPLIWRRHPTLPMIQALPLTQSKSPPNYPNASRQLAPFELAVNAQQLPQDWVFGVESDNGAKRWPTLMGSPSPAKEWLAAFDLPLVALSLPGMVLDPHAAPSKTGLVPDEPTALPMQYRFDLPYTDQINALAQVPKIPRNPEEVSPLPDSPPPEPPKPLSRETLMEYWTSLSTRASLAAADAIEAFRKQGSQIFIQHLVEPLLWPVRPETDLSVYPGSMTIENANGGDPAAIEFKGEAGLEGISGTFSADAGGNLHRLTGSANGDAYHITAGSMAAFREADGRFRDQRGLVRAAASAGDNLLKTPILLKKAIGDDDAYELTSALLPLDLTITDMQKWQFWFRDLPIDSQAMLFDREFTISAEAKEKDFDINDPEAMAREHNHLTGYEWRLGEAAQTGEFLVIHGLHFYPLTLEKVQLAGDTVQQIEIIGRLQLPLEPALEITDLSNAVRLIFTRNETNNLTLDSVSIVSSEGEWPLAMVDGEVSDAPLLRWKQVALNAERDGLEIGDVELHYFLFDVEWSLQLQPLQFPPNDGAETVAQSYIFDGNQSLPIYPGECGLTLDMKTFLHDAVLTLNIQLGERAVDGLLARYTFNEGSDPTVVYDVSGAGSPLNLKINNPNAVEWMPQSGLTIKTPTALTSEGSAAKLTEAVRNTAELSIEAWIHPGNITQNAVLASIAKGSTVNTSLSQRGAAFETQLRTLNELSTLSGGVATVDWLHVVYTHDVWGTNRLYINGVQQAEKASSGNLDVWDATMPLILANSAAENQPWLGTYRMLAIYNRALTPAEVTQNFQLQLKAAQRAAFQTQVQFPLVREKQAITWQNPVLFDDLHLENTAEAVLYTDKAIQFNWERYIQDEQTQGLQLLPGMAIDTQQPSAPGFAVITFDVIASFKLDAALEDELKNARMTVKLQTAFEQNGISISRNATIQPKGTAKWEIADGAKEYQVHKSANGLLVFMGIPALPMRSAFVEALLTCHWGEYLSEAHADSVFSDQMVFGSSAGDLAFGYTANWRDIEDVWEESFLLNGFVEIKNLISWPTVLDYKPENTSMTLPPARADGFLGHTRHSLRVLLNQHEIPTAIPVVGEANLLFNFAHDKPWQFLAVVEHQLIDIVKKEDGIGIEGVNDRRWTALQEVRFTSPKTFRKFLETPKRGTFISPLFQDEKASITKAVANGEDDVNEDGDAFTNNQQTIWLGTGAAANKSYTGLRFQNINLPRGAQITAAHLEFITAVDSPAALNIEVSADAVDNSAAFSATKKPSGRTLTQAKIKVNITAAWKRAETHKVEGLAPVIQEIINRSGWKSGNSLSLIIQGKNTAANQRKVVGSFNAAAAAAPRLVIEYSIANNTLVNYGYFGLEMRTRLTGTDHPELAKMPPNTFLVEASAPHWIKQIPAPNVGATALQYLPNGTQMGILSNPQDYAPSSYLDPRWLLLTMPFLGRLQNAAHDYLAEDSDSSAAGALQIDPVFNLDLKRAQTPNQPLPDLSLAFANWGDDAPIQINFSAFDTDVARLFARLDTLSLEENWFRLQNPLAEPQASSLQSVTASLPNTPARLSRSVALRRAFDSFRVEYPPDLPPESYQLPPEVSGEDLIWREDSLMVTQGISSISASHVPPYNWHLIGLLIQNSEFSQNELQAEQSPRRYPAATIMPARLKADGKTNATPVSFAISPYLGVEFHPAELPMDIRVIATELLCLDRNAKILLPVASYLQEFNEENENTDLGWQDWAQKTHLRLSPDSPVAVLRFRQINRSGGEALLTTTYAFEVVNGLQLKPQLAQRVFRIRSAVESLRFRQGQYGGYIMPQDPQPFEIAPPQTTGVQPLYLNEAPGEAKWPWGLSALRMSVQYTENKDGVVGNILDVEDEQSTLWWQSPQYALQFRSTKSDRPAASLPRKFRARAIRSLLPVLPNPPMPDVNLKTLSDDASGQASWQAVLPGSFRYLVTGSRAGAMFVFRNQLLRQSGLTQNNQNEIGRLMVSGSVPVQHRMPRSVPLPPNTQKLYALQPWASYFEPDHNSLVTNSLADEAFLADFESKPAVRLQVELVSPNQGAVPTGWNGDILVRMRGQNPAFQILGWGLKLSLINNGNAYLYEYPTPIPSFSLNQLAIIPGAVSDEAREAFDQNGIKLSADAFIISDNRWEITINKNGTSKSYKIFRDGDFIYIAQVTTNPDGVEELILIEPVKSLDFEETMKSNPQEAIKAIDPNFKPGDPINVLPISDLQIIDGHEAYTLRVEGTQINVYHNLYSLSLKTTEDSKKITAGSIALEAQVRHITTTKGFYQTLNFPLRFADQTLLPLPLEPYFIHFEDPEYNRQLASSSAHASGNVKEVVGDEEVLHTVTLSADRKQYNPDSHVALRYDWDDDRPQDAADVHIKLSRVSKDGATNPLNGAGEAINPKELKLFSLAKQLKDAKIQFSEGDRLQMAIEVNGEIIVLQCEIVFVPVTPVPQAAYGLLHKQIVGEQMQVECSRFAWSPEATRIELVCPEDLRTEIVRRRAVFHWHDSARPKRDNEYMIQKITFSGSTHFPDFES